MKKCNKCHEVKLFSDFHKHKTTKDGLGTYCKPCYNSQTFAGKLKKRYGITPEQAAEMKKNGCEMCGTHNNLHIDHNHTTGKVRGILCTNCNRGLGHFKDSPDLLQKAIQYLKERGNYSKWQN
jgi:hypothetical protein